MLQEGKALAGTGARQLPPPPWGSGAPSTSPLGGTLGGFPGSLCNVGRGAKGNLVLGLTQKADEAPDSGGSRRLPTVPVLLLLLLPPGRGEPRAGSCRGHGPRRREDAVRGHQAELVHQGRAARGPPHPRDPAPRTPRPGSSAAAARPLENKQNKD